MIEKWEQRAIHMNFKKAVIIFLITCFVLMISASVILYRSFQNRIAAWEQVRETEREHWEEEESPGESKRNSWEIHLSWGDLALLAGCAAIEMVLGIWYWLLVMIWAYRKAYRMGINGSLVVLAALFFNLAAVAVLYLYGILKGTCAVCGKVKSENGNFCDRCGNPLKKECPQCRQEVDPSSAYCRNCGKKLNEDKETEK